MRTEGSQPRKALGKGLAALLPERPRPTPEPAARNAVIELPIEEIAPSRVQPRTVFDPEALGELASSIRAHGILQPLIVRKLPQGGYELVAGERRWRAARMAGLKTVPAVVQDVADNELLEISLIENIQREDLNPIELAQAFDRMVKQLGLTHDEIARRTGKDRTTITNTLRLLKLPEPVQTLVAERRLSMGHARALLGLPTPELQVQLAERAVSEGYSVRQIERLVRKLTEPRQPRSLPEMERGDPNVRAAVERLEQVLGTRVRIIPRGDGRGKIEIEYYSEEDLQRIYEIITGDG